MKKPVIVLILTLIAAFFYCCTSMAQRYNDEGLKMKLTSPAFKNNEYIPARFTGEGQNINPALDIEDIPAGTKSLALIVDDPDAPMKTWVHWVVYDIPPVVRIDENSIPGNQGINDSGGKDYHGPYPPSGTHRYYFKIYALDEALGLREGASRAELEKEMNGKIISSAELIGLYKLRKK